MQSSIMSCSCDGYAGGFGAYGEGSTLLAMDSVRACARTRKLTHTLAMRPPSACDHVHRPSKTAQQNTVVADTASTISSLSTATSCGAMRPVRVADSMWHGMV